MKQRGLNFCKIETEEREYVQKITESKVKEKFK